MDDRDGGGSGGLVHVGDRPGAIQQAARGPAQSLTEHIQDVLSASMLLAKLKRQVVETAVQVTNENDWTNQGGKPYLTETGAMKAASVLPIEVSQVERPCKTWSDDEDGRFYIYVCEFEARWSAGGLGSVTATGTCSSRDKFFAMRDGERLPLAKIDETNLIKKCATNGRRNAIVRLLGLQNLTWEEVTGFGIDRSKVLGTDYDGKRKRGEEPEGAEGVREEIRKMLLEMNRQNQPAAAAQLEEITTFNGRDGKKVNGKRHVKYLSAAQAEVTLKQVAEIYRAWKEQQQAPPSPTEPPPPTTVDAGTVGTTASPGDAGGPGGVLPGSGDDDPMIPCPDGDQMRRSYCNSECRSRKGCPSFTD